MPAVLGLLILVAGGCREWPDDLRPDGAVGPTTDGAVIDAAGARDAASGGPRDLGGWTWDLEGADPDAPAERVPSPDRLSPATPRLTIRVADVGQGDGAVLRLPGGGVLVIDGGPSADALVAALDAADASRVDAIVLSHAHADHYAGLARAIERLPKDCEARVFDPGLPRDFASYNGFRAAAGCRWRQVSAGQTLNLDPAVEATVMAAHDALISGADPVSIINDSSIILRLRYARFSMLFQGDAQTAAEREAFDMLGGRLRSTVLKVGHHGSCNATASSYLDTVAPQFVTMSMAAGNSYGHPHLQTLDRLRAHGVPWGRTDANGTITLDSDGVAYYVALDRGAESATQPVTRACSSPPLDF